MTYVELIVVLGIFAVMSTIVMFNYGAFQDKIDVKNLASQIALKIVEAQKSAVNGKLSNDFIFSLGKPSYGVYFNIGQNTQFQYFANKDNDGNTINSTLLDTITISKGSISHIFNCTGLETDRLCVGGDVLTTFITFTRPDTSANFTFYERTPLLVNDHLQIEVTSLRGSKAYINVYPSGRIKIN